MNKLLDYLTSTRYASRKFILSMACLISASALSYTGHISDGVYSSVLIATVGAYLAANVGQKAVVDKNSANQTQNQTQTSN